MELWLILSIPVVLMTAWLYTTAVARTRLPTLREKAIVLLIAHPDDEAMFFSPTVLGLTRPELGNHLKILCLSNGNADGLGATRTREIEASALLLGLRSSADVMVYDDPRFPDSMRETWSAAAIAGVLSQLFVKEKQQPGRAAGRKAAANEAARGGRPPPTSIDVLITFDGAGVSGHPNHKSLYYGALEWVRGLMKDKTGWEAPVTVYSLTSVNIARKYIGGFDAPWTMLWGMLGTLWRVNKGLPLRLLFMNDVMGYRTAQKAMTQAHKSQMVWFRWGWITIGRYMVVNDLIREKIV